MKLSHFFTSAALFATLCVQTSCSGGSGSDRYSEIELMPVKLEPEGKWSMINHDGKVVYDGEFSEKPSAAVNGFFSVKEGDGYTLYTSGGKTPRTVDGMEKLKCIGYVSEGLIPVTRKDSRIEVMNTDGDVVFELTPYHGAEIVSCYDAFSEGLLSIRTEDGKSGYCDTKGDIVISPAFDFAGEFQDGLAIVRKDGENPGRESAYSVIDKNGETVFKIKEGMMLLSYDGFRDGYILLKEDDRTVLCDTKGQLNKLPSKIELVLDFNSKYIIYRNDNGCGVCDHNGEIIIRPKYEYLAFNTGNTYFAKKEDDDDEILVLDESGEQIRKAIDFKYIQRFGKFGYMAEDTRTWVLLDDDFKSRSKDEYYDYSLGKTACYSGVTTDYFDKTDVARKMAEMIKGNKVCGITLGSSASSLFPGELASDYRYKSSVTMEKLRKSYFSYSMGCGVDFTDDICSSEWNSSSNTSSYQWNPEAKVLSVDLAMKCDKEWGAAGQRALVKALKNSGFKTDTEADEQTTLLKKGNVLVLAVSANEGAMLIVIDATVENIEGYLKDNMSAIANKFRDSIS